MNSIRWKGTEKKTKLQKALSEVLEACKSTSLLTRIDWESALASLPLTSEEFLFVCNWMASAEQLVENGETGAAEYQLKQVHLRCQSWQGTIV